MILVGMLRAIGKTALVLGLFASHVAFAAPAANMPDLAAQPDPALWADLRWRLLGPFRGGWAAMVEGVPTRPDTFYFAAAGGGVWRTYNAGQTWRSLFDKESAASIGALAVAPSDPETLYVGSGQPEPRYDMAAGRACSSRLTAARPGLTSVPSADRLVVTPPDPGQDLP